MDGRPHLRMTTLQKRSLNCKYDSLFVSHAIEKDSFSVPNRRNPSTRRALTFQPIVAKAPSPRASQRSVSITKSTKNSTTNISATERKKKTKESTSSEPLSLVKIAVAPRKLAPKASSFGGVALPKNAIMKIRLHISKLRRRGGNINNKAPNPYYEMFVSSQRLRVGGSLEATYQSYPLMNQREGTWEEAVLDFGIPRTELVITDMRIGIRVMHCPKKGGAQSIGLCRTSLESLRRQPGTGIPILWGFEVMGWLRVLSISVE
jgi:hypothetical protein